MPKTRAPRGALVAAVAVVLAGAAYLLWVFALTLGASEGDIPDASRIELPAGAEIIGEESGCASGGCWVTITVRPPAGQSAEELATEIGATPQLDLAGNVFDPRTVRVWATPSGGTLSLRADYWSEHYIP